MTAWELTNTLAAFLLPPGALILLIAGGYLLRRAHPHAARALLVGGLAGLYLVSMPLVAGFLLRNWETPPVKLILNAGQAIVVLGGGKYPQAPEYAGDTVSGATLVRLRYAAHLHRTSGHPVLVSGGSPDGSTVNEAQTMKQTLEQEFAVPVRWAEGGSDNTLQNARLSYRMLRSEGIHTIFLVTHAWHMPRARLAFEQSGFRVIPAPTAHTTSGPLSILDFIPDARALHASSLFCHEIIGMFWYRLRLLFQAQAREFP
ncbi:MAG: YdcF family protein [Burkholderiales bacterium]